MTYFKCPSCGMTLWTDEDDTVEWCPECGAEMEVSE